MNYELAKKLKNAGFPQPIKDSDFEGNFICGCKEKAQSNGIELKEVLDCGMTRVYAPTLSELIEACHSQWSKFTLEQNYKADGLGTTSEHEWSAGIQTNKEGHFTGEGSSPEEAVANLWLKLHG